MADTTTLAESAQALFCALAEYVNIKKTSQLSNLFDKETNKDFLLFDRKWSEVFKSNQDSIESIYERFTRAGDKSKVLPYSDVKDFLVIKKDWYTSSLIIAEKFVNDIGSVPGLQAFSSKPSVSDIWFYRGDKEVMENISDLFSIANKNEGNYFGDLNKWSPADIYFAEKSAREEIKKNLAYYGQSKNKGQYGFDILNNMISSLIKNGELLPISLKKTTSSVIIKPVNFDRREEEMEILTYRYRGLRQDWKKSTKSNPQTRDLQISFTSNPKEYIQIRHDASNGEKSDGFKCEHLGGGEAKGGGVSSIRVFTQLFGKIDKSAATKFEQLWRQGSTSYKQEMKPKRAKLEKDLIKSKNAEAKKLIKNSYDEDRGIQSALYVTNDAFTFLIAWLEKNSKSKGNSDFIVSPADRFIQELYSYITSRTERSSKFVIMKG